MYTVSAKKKKCVLIKPISPYLLKINERFFLIFFNTFKHLTASFSSFSHTSILPFYAFFFFHFQEIIPKPRSKKWISTSIPEERWGEPIAQTAGAQYHANNLLSSVLFYEGLQKVRSMFKFWVVVVFFFCFALFFFFVFFV